VGSSGLVASDGTSSYSWDPSGNLTGVRQGGAGVLAYTDAHTEVVGDFTAKGSALSGSAAFDPWGAVTATSGTPSGRLGFQSQYTDPASGQVDMGPGGMPRRGPGSVTPTPSAWTRCRMRRRGTRSAMRGITRWTGRTRPGIR